MNRWGPGASTERALYRCLYSLRNTRGRAKVGLSMATPADNKILVNSLLAGIQARQSDDRKLLLTSFAMRMPIGTKRQLKKAVKLRGISQTDIILELLDVALPALLGEQEDRQQDLLTS